MAPSMVCYEGTRCLGTEWCFCASAAIDVAASTAVFFYFQTQLARYAGKLSIDHLDNYCNPQFGCIFIHKKFKKEFFVHNPQLPHFFRLFIIISSVNFGQPEKCQKSYYFYLISNYKQTFTRVKSLTYVCVCIIIAPQQLQANATRSNNRNEYYL